MLIYIILEYNINILMNPYEILGLDSNTSIEDIKLKYRQLASENHPDKGGDTEKFKLISLAYQILIDPIKRKTYDQNGVFFADSSVLQEVKDHLQRIFQNQINVHDPNHHDLILSMKNEVNTSKSHIIASLEQTKLNIQKFEKIKNKLKMKQKSENILLELLENRINDSYVDIKGLTRRLQVYDYMVSILDNYHYSELEWHELLTTQ